MKRKIDWRVFVLLAVAVMIGATLSIPYIMALFGDIIAEEEISIFLQVFSVFIMGTVLGIIGLVLGKSLGLGLPWVENFLDGKLDKSSFLGVVKKSIIWGVLIGLGITLADRLLFYPFSSELQQLTVPPAWQGFLASFYGGIIEEVLLRLFFATFIIWLINRLFGRNKKEVPSRFYWIGISVAAVLFAVGHLPAVEMSMALTPLLVIRTLFLNSIPGVIFGWLYWKNGLESAVIAHFFADIVLHAILFPIIFGT